MTHARTRAKGAADIVTAEMGYCMSVPLTTVNRPCLALNIRTQTRVKKRLMTPFCIFPFVLTNGAKKKTEWLKSHSPCVQFVKSASRPLFSDGIVRFIAPAHALSPTERSTHATGRPSSRWLLPLLCPLLYRYCTVRRQTLGALLTCQS